MLRRFASLRSSAAPTAASAVCLAFVVASRVARADEPAAPIQIETGGDQLEVFSRTDAVTMHTVWTRHGSYEERSPVYAPVCPQTPCSPLLPNGIYHLALSRPGGPLVADESPIAIHGPMIVHGTFKDRGYWRAFGLITALVTPIVAVPLMLHTSSETQCLGGSPATGPTTVQGTGTDGAGNPVSGVTGTIPGSPAVPCSPTTTVTHPYLVAGAAVLAVGLIASLAMSLQRDEATFTVEPLTLGAMPGARESGGVASLPNGLEATIRF